MEFLAGVGVGVLGTILLGVFVLRAFLWAWMESSGRTSPSPDECRYCDELGRVKVSGNPRQWAHRDECPENPITWTGDPSSGATSQSTR